MKNQLKFVIVVLSLIFCANAQIDDVTNGIFTIYLDNTNGLFTIATGASHPVGAGHSVLFGGDDGQPLTTYISIYSNVTGTQYVNSETVINATLIEPETASIAEINTATEKGFTVPYVINEGDDQFNVVVTIVISGTTYQDSVVAWKADITNNAGSSAKIGVRFLWDFQIAEDDGPTFQAIVPTSGRFSHEREYTDVFFREFAIEGNRPNSAYFKILAAAAGPVDWSPPLSPALSKLSFTSWQSTYETPYFYETTGSNVAVNLTSLNDDSCIILFWGDRYSTLKDVAAGATFSVVSSFSVEETAPIDELVAQCADNYTCTYDYINWQDEFTFDCLNLPIHSMCDDQNSCTNDVCDPYNYQADPETGCVNLDRDCSDQIACTMDVCNATTGECDHFPSACDDEIDCTVDTCDLLLGQCTNTPADDYCQPTSVDLCNNYFCDADIGCYSTAIVCDDDIHCTEDTCEPAIGCVFTPQASLCDDNITCTEDMCDVAIGRCVNIPRNDYCDDFDGCTTDLCDINVDCVFLEVTCADEIQCTRDICMNGSCLYIALDEKCNDNNNCTIDTCDSILGDCTNIPSDDLCDDDQWCTLDSCDEIEGCQYTERNCDDEIACTDDWCDYFQQKCVHSVANETLYCDDQIDCTVDVCDVHLGRCDHRADNFLCDDGDACTIDVCELGARGCTHTPITCNDQIACTSDTCVEGVCVHDVIVGSCDDGFDCTEDFCSEEMGRCVNIPTNAYCDDSVACTMDICNYTHCLNIARDDECEDDIPCTINVCREDGCYLTVDNSICDDGIDCTYDYCDPDFGCRYVLNHNSCDDGFTCTENYCDLQVGCSVRLHDELCDDNITCSADTCSEESGCVYEYRDSWCNDDVGCTVDTCVPVEGCVNVGDHLFCDDGRNCSTEYCDLDYGCIINDTSCAQDQDVEHCINCKSSLSRIVVNDLEDGSGDLLLNTRNIPVEAYSVASPTHGIVDNLLIKGSGQIVLGDEEFLDSQDGLVIGSSSNFRLVPSEQSLPDCNEFSRGSIQILSEMDFRGVDLIDHMYICLQSENTYQWRRAY